MEPDPVLFDRNVLLEALGELAAALQVSGVVASIRVIIERGSTSPTARTLQRIAEALNSDLRLVARAR
jgi:transcriptional regulator with XRE-family HTH domain